MRIFSLSQMSKVKLVSTLPWREKIAEGNRLHPFPWRGEGPWVGVEKSCKPNANESNFRFAEVQPIFTGFCP